MMNITLSIMMGHHNNYHNTHPKTLHNNINNNIYDDSNGNITWTISDVAMLVNKTSKTIKFSKICCEEL